MKLNNVLVFGLFVLSIFALVSCSDDNDDTQKPVVSNLEVGHSDTIHIGEGIHLEFEVEDDNRLDYYRITIHPEEDHEKSAGETLSWTYDSTFTEVSGLRNYTVHQHDIVVPETAEEGDYHFHLAVADQAGNVTEIEKDLVASHEEGEHEHED